MAKRAMRPGPRSPGPRNPDPGSPGLSSGPLTGLLIRSLSELPINTQLALFREVAPSRPFVYIGDDGPVSDTESIGYVEWFSANRHQLAAGLLHYHGLDRDRIALLHEFGAMGEPPYIREVELSFSFGASGEYHRNVTQKRGTRSLLSLHEVAVTTSLLVGFDSAFRVAFEPLGLRDTNPELLLSGGTVEAILTGSAAGLGILIALDAVTGGATLPLTAPFYAKAAVGGALMLPQTVNFLNEQRNKWAQGTKTFIEAQSIPNRAFFEDKMRAETAKATREGQKALSEALRAQAEALTLLGGADVAVAKVRAETEKLEAEAKKLLAEIAGKPVEESAPATAPPPSANVPMQVIQNAASQNNVSVQVALVAMNAGLPLLAEARSAGVECRARGRALA